MPCPAWGLAVLLLAAGAVPQAAAQPMPGMPVGGPETLSTSLPPEPNPTLSRSLPPEPPPATATLPPVLGSPVGPADRIPSPSSGVRAASNIQTGGSDLSTTPVLNNDYLPRRGASLGTPVTSSDAVITGGTTYPAYPNYADQPTVRADQPPAYGNYGSVPATTDPNEFLRSRTVQVDQNYNPPSSSPNSEHQSDKFADEFNQKLEQWLGKRNEWFKSDHAFDGFVSPMSNPFLFEDPRSLTEVRLIFDIDKLPNSNPEFHGGNTFFFGTQLRLAITDQLSFVINKFGGESFNPGSGSPLPDSTGFAEFWFGPKWTFIRNEATGTLAAAGLQFQCPVGGKNNYQDTGSLTIVPYFSYTQSILRDCSVGTINGMAGGGYALSVNGDRSDYLYLSAHVDWNVMNNNHWFPLFEMNWFMYTTNGNNLPAKVEGLDQMNFGGHAAGEGLLSGAIGTRYKFTENYQLGVAFDFPIAGPREIMSYGFTLDFILRY